MKIFVYILYIFIDCCILNCNRSISQGKPQQMRQFLYKTELNTSTSFYGTHIEIKQVLPDTIQGLIPNSIDDRDIIGRSKYSRDEQAEILGEYLTFRGDTSVSNKQYKFKAASHMIRPEGVKGFTIEIEALYSFTRMLTQGLPPIRPILINRITGEELNENQKVVGEVYDIYVKWYKKNKREGFKNFVLPLADSPYCWLGEDKGMGPFLKKSL